MPPQDLGPDMPRQLFCFVEQFEHSFREWILARFAIGSESMQTRDRLGNDGIRAIENILAKPFVLHAPLGPLLSEDIEALNVLTQQQFHILTNIQDVQRAAISGSAGTGKTVLALEEARRCSKDGLRTLYTCYNRPLAIDVSKRLEGLPNLVVLNFHTFCKKIVDQAGIKIPKVSSQRRLFDDVFPELLMQAFDSMSVRQFDAIIVDEGQDFSPLWWSALDSGLDPRGKTCYAYFLTTTKWFTAKQNASQRTSKSFRYVSPET